MTSWVIFHLDDLIAMEEKMLGKNTKATGKVGNHLYITLSFSFKKHCFRTVRYMTKPVIIDCFAVLENKFNCTILLSFTSMTLSSVKLLFMEVCFTVLLGAA